MHMLANAYCDLGHDVRMLSPARKTEGNARYKLVHIDVGTSNRLVRWARSLATYEYDADMVHFSGDDFLVPGKQSFVHLRTFMGSCTAEAVVAKGLRNKVRMYCLGLTESISSLRFKCKTVISDQTNQYLMSKGRLVPCGVDLDSFRPGATRSSEPTILFVGMLDSRKRGLELVKAFCEIVRPIIPTAELWIVRDNTKIDHPGVRVFGSISQEKLVELYQRSWVFCLPSSYEGFGVPYIEAMACGTPVVATANPGAHEVLDGGKFGIITDLDQLGDQLVRILLDDKRRDVLSENGLVRAKQYDILQVAQRYIEFSREYAQFKGSR